MKREQFHIRSVDHSCIVYILASRRHGTLYIVHRLVYVEIFERPDEAITREKQLKRWKRDWKIELIERDNPEWRDLSDLLV